MSDTIVGALIALGGAAFTAIVGLWAQRQNNRVQERLLRLQLHEAKKREILHEVNVGITDCYEALATGRPYSFSNSCRDALNLVYLYCDRETNGAILKLAMMAPVGASPRAKSEIVEAAYREAQQAIMRELSPDRETAQQYRPRRG